MIFKVLIDDIFVPDGRRPVDAKKVAQLAESMRALGQLHPLLVRKYECGHVKLVAGAHRIAAAKLLAWSEIEAVFLDVDDAQMRRVEIAENLHRNELTALEQSELTAEWIRLAEADLQSSGLRTIESRRGDGRGHRPKSGVNAASRELGIPKSTAHENVKIASLSSEAKAMATETGLDDNRSALLAAAKESDAQSQVEALKERMARQKNERAAKRRDEKGRPKVNEISLAWLHATQKHRREFALQYRTEIMRAQQSGGLAGPAADRAEAVRLAADRAEERSQSTAADPLDIPAELRRVP